MVKRRKRYDQAPKRAAKAHPPSRREWIYGLHAVIAAANNPDRVIHRLVTTQQGAEALNGVSADPEIISRDEIDRILPGGAVHQGVALETDPLAETALGDLVVTLCALDSAVVLVLDRVSDPRNVGAILRSAAAFGARAVIVPERHAAESTGALAKAASGALETVPLVRVVNLSRAMEQLKSAGMWCIGLDSEAKTDIDDADLTGRVALVLGAEGAGLRRLTRENCDLTVRLPMAGGVPSLNVSNAAAIALYVATRRT